MSKNHGSRIGTYWINEVDVYFMNHFFGLNKNTCFRIGALRTIDGITFEKAIKVTVSGYLVEGGPKKTITRIFWLVNAPRQD